MLNLNIGLIDKILEERNNLIKVLVKIDDDFYQAIAYKAFIDKIDVGDIVLLNTTAVDLNLGTGGYHFVLANITRPKKESKTNGHIMKLRYTPLQLKVEACEEEKSRYHEIFNYFQGLDKMPVLIGGLHSILAPLAIILKEYRPDIKISYIMTDSGCLPIDFSDTVYILKDRGYIDKTITIGHAFGGDYECVNIYNGLIAAKEIAKSDIAIVSMGPGIVGTGTQYGFTGIEQGYIIDAVNDFGGIPICVPRISFKDKRDRHFGISHHTLKVLSTIAKTRANIAIPRFGDEKESILKKQITSNGLDEKHNIYYFDYSDIIDILNKSLISISTMGRNLHEDSEYFCTVGVNGKLALEFL